MREIRRLDIVWHEEEVADYEELKRQSDSVMTNIPDFVKAVLKKHIRRIP
jgi:isocitrate lyase